MDPVFGLLRNKQPDIFGARFGLTGNYRRLGADSAGRSD